MASIAPTELVETLDGASSWPYEVMPKKQQGAGDWTLWMDRGASMVIWPTSVPGPVDFGMIPVYQSDKETLEKFLVTFCSLGWAEDARFKHQNGEVRLFNWRSFTLAQIYIASQVAHLFAKGAWDEAWATGKAFGDQIDAAAQDFFEAREKVS